MVAGSADKFVQPRTFASKHKNAVASEIELVVLRGPTLVETDDPEILLFEFFESTNEVDHARDPEVLRGTRTGFYRYRTDGSRTPLSEDDAVNTGSVGNAKESPQILRVFHAIECQQQPRSRSAGFCGRRRKEVLNRESLLRANESNHALVGSGSGELGELFARFLANTDPSLAALGHEMSKAVVMALAGYEYVIKTAAAGPECLLDGMQAVENFHMDSVDGGRLLGAPAGRILECDERYDEEDISGRS